MLYPFVCENCGEFELELKMKDIPLKKCPKCGSEKVERIFRPVESVWKCSGSFSKKQHRNGE